MGSILSGPYNSGYKTRKRTVEEFPCIDISKLKNRLKLDSEYAKLSYTINNVKYEEILCLDWVSCNYGGKRPFLICRECGERTTKLYRKNNIVKCRTCHNLTYRRTQISGDGIAEADWEIKKIYKRLGMEHEETWNYSAEPKGKPKNMHETTYLRLRLELMHLREKRQSAWIDGARSVLGL